MRDGSSNWPERPLGELLDIVRHTVIPGTYPEEQFVHYSIPAWDEMRGPALESGASIGSAKLAINQPTILVSKLNPRIPRVVLVENPIGPRYCASTEFIPYVAQAEGVSLRFYKWLLEGPTFQRRLEGIATGSTNSHKRAHPAETLRWPVPYPPPQEQSHIATVLDTVDEVIAKTEVVIAKLKQVRAGLLYDLLTRGLDLSACDLPVGRHDAQAGEHGHLRDPIAHPGQFQDSPLGRIPMGWEVRSLESVTDVSAPICYGIVQALEFVADGVPVLVIRDLLGDYVTGIHRTAKTIDASYARSRVRPGDVLISIKGTIGRIDVVPKNYEGNISRDLARIRPTDRVRAKYLLHLLRSQMGQKILEQAQVGTTRAELSIGPLKRLYFAFPKPAEQESIACMLDEHEATIRTHEVELAKLRELKSGLMTDLLTGRVRVPVLPQDLDGLVGTMATGRNR